MSADELVTLVDENDAVIGAAPRSEMRRRRLPHRSTYILVFNAGGELFVQKRTASKDIFPGYYDVAAGGVVLYGESYEQGARRELGEELGIYNAPLEHLFNLYYVDELVRVWGSVFTCMYDGALVLQAEEIEAGEFMRIATVFERAREESFTPDGLTVLRDCMARFGDREPFRISPPDKRLPAPGKRGPADSEPGTQPCD